MRVFLDTNVFLYAFLNQDVAKKMVAVKILATAIGNGNGYVSLQVAKEFCSVMTKKSSKPISELAVALDLISRFNCAAGSFEKVRRALEIKDQYGIQFYDALIVAAAEANGCDEILTEDLNDGQVYCGIKAVNPFKE
ncbi:MAG: PIN domain-containing protein [Kiritimatiellae bacterium]|nr:PIN domain-containing protein [Kiritimatiellia bacterium]